MPVSTSIGHWLSVWLMKIPGDLPITANFSDVRLFSTCKSARFQRKNDVLTLTLSFYACTSWNYYWYGISSRTDWNIKGYVTFRKASEGDMIRMYGLMHGMYASSPLLISLSELCAVL